MKKNRNDKKIKKPKGRLKTQNTRAMKVKTFFLDALFFIAGGVCYAFAINMFTAPNEIAPGGVTGLATIINHLTGLPIGIMMLAMNIPLFILAVIILGRGFLLKTIIATIIMSSSIDLLAPFIPDYSGDRLLASLFGGLLSGLALGLVFVRGATSGGTDIIGKVLKKFFPHLPMGTLILLLDLCVVSVAGLVYKSIESMLYAIIVFFVSSRVINFLLYGTGNGKMLMIVCSSPQEVAKEINKEMHRGVTIFPVQGAYTGEDRKMLLCVVRPNEVARVQKIIKLYDQNPFIIISEAGEILGEGFKPFRN